jgi:hypothetical protein
MISQEILDLMTKFRNMVSDCIRIGLQNNVTSLKTLSTKSHHYLGRYDIVTYYKVHAISRASGILQNRKKSIKRGFKTKTTQKSVVLVIKSRANISVSSSFVMILSFASEIINFTIESVGYVLSNFLL